MPAHLLSDLPLTVTRALAEDVGSGDVTARLVPAGQQGEAKVIARESAIICGQPWVDEVFRQLDPNVKVTWQVADGARVEDGQILFTLQGASRSLLTGERTALNFLQALSGTATETARYVEAVRGTAARIVDTRKTLPGLRNAQKYAVTVGGGVNHRIGLYDGILVKENHIAAAGGIEQAIAQARALGAAVPLMTEAETLDEVRAALRADVDLLLVDDFDGERLREAVRLTRDHRAGGGRTLIEYSGGATLARIRELAESGVDRISIGSLTKHVRAVDLSMRFV
ncbi:nicotinate-nucleotide pyrophosphorylase [carboxylating] [Panacagrimonas perspica]|uniref:Probable nicotinate-nucleotide pyrophosphorylase [carboxylating] n=1 Tax=Panacagrimonas perspica TaxID=381431 RepID=A0A4S3K1V3_9GAMM|nr:carboxylating nicotinate-nucleotide diphosphorylase [Panacagrimonas perspica]TDU30913.1 nicotinate-nucleotide pyrophosphorylase [carboxylating] [Panacagrimonas perspica]THD01933.1 nicotinate-nucleotide diphosphorylase (carboxylating) [Panacagrimonas perspica]